MRPPCCFFFWRRAFPLPVFRVMTNYFTGGLAALHHWWLAGREAPSLPPQHPPFSPNFGSKFNQGDPLSSLDASRFLLPGLDELPETLTYFPDHKSRHCFPAESCISLLSIPFKNSLWSSLPTTNLHAAVFMKPLLKLSPCAHENLVRLCHSCDVGLGTLEEGREEREFLLVNGHAGGILFSTYILRHKVY